MTQSRDWHNHIRPEAKNINKAIIADDLDTLKKLVNKDNINTPLDTIDAGMTPLAAAVHRAPPDLKIVQFLLSFKEKCDIDKEVSRESKDAQLTTLGSAIGVYSKEKDKTQKAARLQCIVLLIEQGANLDHPSVQKNVNALKADDNVRGLIELFRGYKNLTPTQIKEKGECETEISIKYSALRDEFNLVDFIYPLKQRWNEKAYAHGDSNGGQNKAVHTGNGASKSRLEAQPTRIPEVIMSVESTFSLYKKEYESDRRYTIERLEAIIKNHPSHALEACLALARIHIDMNKLDDANKYFHQAKTYLNPELQAKYDYFLKGLDSLYGLEGRTKNAFDAAARFRTQLAPSLKNSHPILSAFAYLLSAQGYYELAAESVAVASSSSTEYLINSAISMHHEILQAISNPASQYAYPRQRIYSQLFKLFEIANPKQKVDIQHLILNHVQNDEELHSLQAVMRFLPKAILSYQQLFDAIRNLYAKKTNPDARLVITECVEQFPEEKDAQFNFLKEQALGDFFSDNRDLESLKAAIQHYAAANKFAAECQAFFPKKSLGKAHRRYADAVKTINFNQKLAYYNYDAAARLGDFQGALQAANIASQDQKEIFNSAALKLYRQAFDLANKEKHWISLLEQLKKFRMMLAPLPEQLAEVDKMLDELEPKLLQQSISSIVAKQDNHVLENLITLYGEHAEFKEAQSIVNEAKKYIEAAVAKHLDEIPRELSIIFLKKYPNKSAVAILQQELFDFTQNLLRQKTSENHEFFPDLMNLYANMHARGESQEIKATTADEYIRTARDSLKYHPLKTANHKMLRDNINCVAKSAKNTNSSDARELMNFSWYLEQRAEKTFAPSMNPAAKPLLIEAYDSAKHYIKTKHTNRALVFCQLTKLLLVDERNHVYANPDEYKQMPIDVDTFEVPISLDADAAQNKKEDRYKFHLLAMWNKKLVEEILPDLRQNPALPDNAAMLHLLETDPYAFMLQAPFKYAILYGFGDEETPFYRDLIIERIARGLKQGLHVSKKWIQEKSNVKPILSCEEPWLSFAAAVKPLSVIIPSAPEIKIDAVVDKGDNPRNTFGFFKAPPTREECDKIGVIVVSMTYTTESHVAEVKETPAPQAQKEMAPAVSASILTAQAEQHLADLVKAMPVPDSKLFAANVQVQDETLSPTRQTIRM